MVKTRKNRKIRMNKQKRAKDKLKIIERIDNLNLATDYKNNNKLFKLASDEYRRRLSLSAISQFLLRPWVLIENRLELHAGSKFVLSHEWPSPRLKRGHCPCLQASYQGRMGLLTARES